MTTTKGLEIRETKHGLVLSMKRGRTTYAQAYTTRDKQEATRLFLELINTYRTKGVLAVMGGW
jgi:hypothetical protein